MKVYGDIIIHRIGNRKGNGNEKDDRNRKKLHLATRGRYCQQVKHKHEIYLCANNSMNKNNILSLSLLHISHLLLLLHKTPETQQGTF